MTIFTFIVGYVLFCTLTCASVAGRKGYSPFAWGIAGFLFGLFALLVIGCMGNSAPAYAAPTSVRVAAGKCECTEAHAQNDTVCQYCWETEPYLRNPANARIMWAKMAEGELE